MPNAQRTERTPTLSAKMRTIAAVLSSLGVGLVIAVLWTRLADPSWYPPGEVEPLVYSIAAATAFLVAVLAGIPSARRAAAIQPMIAIKTD